MSTTNTIVEIKKGQVGRGLLIENDGYIDFSGNMINEALGEIGQEGRLTLENLPDPFILPTVFQKFGIENANGRIYPEHILKREVEKYQRLIEERRAYGECNHPDSSVIDLGRIALNIVELHWEDHTLVGKIEIPVTYGFRKYGIVSTYADTLAQHILSGLKVGVSSRGLGSVVKLPNGKLMVGDDYEIVCWDAVSTPSTPNAWISKSTEETRMYVEDKHNSEKKLVNEDKYSKFDKWLING